MGSGASLVMKKLVSDGLKAAATATLMRASGACDSLEAIGWIVRKTLERVNPDGMKAWGRLLLGLREKRAGCVSWM